MEKHNFQAQPTEWWHFDYRGWQQQNVLHVSFDELNTL
jgi:D-alanyl-D-alanine dipeptidase